MNTAIRLEVLPARLGDCLLVECSRPGRTPWRMLVDGGPPDTWPALEARLGRLDPNDRRIDVAVITHIDSDHIGGMLPFLSSTYAANVGDFWFNGRPHLPEPGRTRSVAQGENVAAALMGLPDSSGDLAGQALPWNEAFDRGPIDTGADGGFLELDVPDGPRITVLSPTTKRLASLASVWDAALEEARRGPGEEAGPDVLEPLDDLEALAGESTAKDSSVSNGSSIALLVEHRGASVVLGADAFGTVLGAALAGVARDRGLDALEVDAFKLPHHTSRANVFGALVRAAPARHYVTSTNGDTFHHPDDAAVARVVLGAPAGATLWFNYRTDRTGRWAEPRLTERHGYGARFPPDDADPGVVLELPERP